MTRECETTVSSVGDEDYQRVYLPARLCRDSQYPLTTETIVKAAVVGSVVVIGAAAAVKTHVTNHEESVRGGKSE